MWSATRKLTRNGDLGKCSGLPGRIMGVRRMAPAGAASGFVDSVMYQYRCLFRPAWTERNSRCARMVASIESSRSEALPARAVGGSNGGGNRSISTPSGSKTADLRGILPHVIGKRHFPARPPTTLCGGVRIGADGTKYYANHAGLRCPSCRQLFSRTCEP